MLILALLVPLLASEYTVPEEPVGVTEIRLLYNEVKPQVSEGVFYLTTVSVNPTGVPYPAVGTYSEETIFYWHLDEMDREETLVFVEHTARYAAHSEYQELLFDPEGDLVFRFISLDNSGAESTEIRNWFEDRATFHTTECLVSDEGVIFLEPCDAEYGRSPEYFEDLFEAML